MTRESDIIHERGDFHVVRSPRTYEVCEHKGTHALVRQAFQPTIDGRSLAVAYCNYLAGARAKDVLDATPSQA